MSNEVDKEVEPTEPPKTFTCTKCGEPQEHFIYRSAKRGWAECLNCGRFTRTKLIPKEFITKVSDGWRPPVSMGDETELDEEYEEGGRIPFRRFAPPRVLVDRVLKKYGVKDRSRNIIVDRCRTAGGMHPSELEKALRSLDTGLSKAAEINYIVEDYYLSLQAEERKQKEFSESRGSYPIRRGDPGYSSERYPFGEEQPTGRQWGYERSLGRPEERYERGREGALTRRELTDIFDRRDRDLENRIERRERDLEERMRRSTLEDKIGSIGEDISVLATELRNLKENPPGQPGPTGPSDYERTLEHTIERQDKRQDELMALVKEERSESKADMKEIRDTYGGRVDRLQEDLKTAERRAISRSSTEGYKADEMRLVADGINRFADIFESRGSPIEHALKVVPMVLGEAGPPPSRERMGPASVADLVGPEYVESPDYIHERGAR